MCGWTDGVMALLLVVGSLEDVRKKEISVRYLSGLTIYASISAILSQRNAASVLGGAGIGLLFFFISKWTQEQIGYGDSWMILAIGIYAGAKNLVWILFAASFGAGMFSLVFCMLHKWNRKYTIPFIPFLAAAFAGVMIL